MHHRQHCMRFLKITNLPKNKYKIALQGVHEYHNCHLSCGLFAPHVLVTGPTLHIIIYLFTFLFLPISPTSSRNPMLQPSFLLLLLLPFNLSFYVFIFFIFLSPINKMQKRNNISFYLCHFATHAQVPTNTGIIPLRNLTQLHRGSVSSLILISKR